MYFRRRPQRRAHLAHALAINKNPHVFANSPLLVDHTEADAGEARVEVVERLIDGAAARRRRGGAARVTAQLLRDEYRDHGWSKAATLNE